MVHVLLVVRVVHGHVRLEDAGGVVHRAALQAGEREDGGVAGLDGAAELRAHRALVADHVRPGAAQARRAHRLVGVDHDMVLRGLHDGVVVVVDERLAVVILAVRDDLAHVTALHGIVAVLVHQVIGLLHPALVIDGGRGAFVVHDEADALAVGILVQRRQVEVRIRGDEVEDEVLLVAVPVLPAFVPALDEETVEAVLGGEVDVAADVLVVRAVPAVRLGSGVVRHAQLHGRIVIRVGPLALAGDHLPPHAHVLGRMDPGDVLDGAGLVQVQDEAGSQHVGGLLAHHHGAPRALARGLQPPLDALGVRGQVRREHEVLVVQVQVRGGIVQHLGLVDVDVQAVGGLHLQGRLHAGLGELGLRRAAGGTRHVLQLAHLRQLGLRGHELLRGVVARDPPGRVVARHRELGEFLLDLEVGQCVLQRELVAEAEAVVIQAETHLHHGALAVRVAQVAGVFRVRDAHAPLRLARRFGRLLQRHQKLVVVVADGRLLAPDRLPGLVEGVEGRVGEGETAVQVLPVQQGVSQAGRQHNGLSGAVQRIFGDAVHDGELELQLPVRAAEDDGVGRHFRGFGPAGGEHGEGRQEKDSFHIDGLKAV